MSAYVRIKIPGILSAARGRCGEGLKLREEGQGIKSERGHPQLEWVGLDFCYLSSVMLCVTKLTNGSVET